MALRFGPYSPTGFASVFTPASISGLQVWHRGDGPMWQDTGRTSAVTANGQTVKAWDDLSGNARHATGASSTLTYSAATNVGGNSKPGLSCTTNTRLTSPYTLSSTFTFFCVWQSSLTPTNFGRAIDGVSTNWLMGSRTNSGQQVSYYANAFAGFSSNYTTNQSLIHMVDQTPTLGAHWVNGTVVAGTISNPGAPGAFNIGSSSAFGESISGFVQEIIIYNRQLSTSERQQVERYLGARYNISTP